MRYIAVVTTFIKFEICSGYHQFFAKSLDTYNRLYPQLWLMLWVSQGICRIYMFVFHAIRLTKLDWAHSWFIPIVLRLTTQILNRSILRRSVFLSIPSSFAVATFFPRFLSSACWMARRSISLSVKPGKIGFSAVGGRI